MGSARFQAVLFFSVFATFEILQLNSYKEYSILGLSPKASFTVNSGKSMHKCRKYKPFAEPTASGKKNLKITWAQGDNSDVTAWGGMC